MDYSKFERSPPFLGGGGGKGRGGGGWPSRTFLPEVLCAGEEKYK